MATKKTKEEVTPFAQVEPIGLDTPAAPLGATPRFSVTLFYYVCVSDVNGENTKRFPGQQTVSADTAEEFMELIGAFYGSLVEEEPGGFVTYEPREIGPQGRQASAPAAVPAASAPAQPAVETPNCPFHGKPITVKQNRGTGASFASCSEKVDGGYCNWKPA